MPVRPPKPTSIEFHNAAEFAAAGPLARTIVTSTFDYAVNLTDAQFAKVAHTQVFLNGAGTDVIDFGALSLRAAMRAPIHLDASGHEVTLTGNFGHARGAITIALDVFNPGANSHIDVRAIGTLYFGDNSLGHASTLGSSTVVGHGGTLAVSGLVVDSDFAHVSGTWAASGLEVTGQANVTLGSMAAAAFGASAAHPFHIYSGTIGGTSDQTIDGSALHDGFFLQSLFGNDMLVGGSGNDTIISAEGMVTGGAGDDTFYVGAVGAHGLTITDFAPGHDHVDLSVYGFAVADFATLMSGATQLAGTAGVRFAFDSAVVTLANTTIAQLHASDFIFGH